MSDELEWYPAHLVDESCPPPKKSPEEFLFVQDGHWQLGYAPADTRILDEDRETCNHGVMVGEVIDFVSCERLGEIEATIRRDGTFDLHGDIPKSYNVVVANHDTDLLYQSVDDLIAAIKKPDAFFNPSEFIFEGSETSARVVLSFANWSDPLPYLFEIVDDKPVLSPVPAQKQ